MWVNPISCQNNKDFKMKIWFQKHAKMTFNFKENVDWTWKGREELQVGVAFIICKQKHGIRNICG